MKPKCIHCRERAAQQHPCKRGLCFACYRDKTIRELYPLLGQSKCRPGKDPKTMEEVEAIIAEQMQNLPPWWEKETRKLRTGLDT